MSAYFERKLSAEVTSAIDDKGKWIRTVTLTGKLVFYTKDGTRIEVPEGFVSDGASAPKLFWSIFPPFGRYLRAAVLHDFLCVQGRAGECEYSSAEVSSIFDDAIIACGVGEKRAWCMWFGVRFFGPQWKLIN